MTSRDFAYWLQGFFEISDVKVLTQEQTQIIKNHLNMVFLHEIDPSMGDKKHQEKLNVAHNKPTLEQLGQQFGFPVAEYDQKWGACPHPGWKLSSLHGWYDPEHGVPRC